ncbi:PD-(D/E)XK nuclease domain-containing protein [Methanomethylophilus alvi]|uniref:PD-(D/E)XK nuclease domain-containing protein n=1 Tax=Methanomethylophilus alvi TaxID=1291540 RepID=UPI0037DCBEA0
MSDGFTPRPYWVDSGGDGVVRWLLERIDDKNFSDIMGLVDLGTVRVRMKEALVFSKLDTSEVSIYSLMAMSGYLKATYAGDGMYDISIPNMEVAGMVEGLLSTITPVSDRLFDDFNRAVLEGDADRMTDILQDILLNGSYMNLEKEYAYELILMTVMHSLTRRYDMKTEYESGNGRTDIIMRPRDGGTVPMIFELKRSASEEDLEADADGAISQIHERKYYMGMKGRVVLFGISFWVKVPKVKVEIVEI